MFKVFDQHLKTINRLLIIAIVLLNGYVLFMPLLPAAKYKIVKATTKPVEDFSTIDRSSDRLLIPSLRLEEKVFYGQDGSLVNKGIWHRPNTVTPDKSGNAVFVGHRFTYADASVFYNLDKVKTGDKLVAVWQGKIYVYKVTETKVVPADAVQIEGQTSDTRLTLYTCEPLWSTKNRLVVTGTLEKIL